MKCSSCDHVKKTRWLTGLAANYEGSTPTFHHEPRRYKAPVPAAVHEREFSEVEHHNALIAGGTQHEQLTTAGQVEFACDAHDSTFADAMNTNPQSTFGSLFKGLRYGLRSHNNAHSHSSREGRGQRSRATHHQALVHLIRGLYTNPCRMNKHTGARLHVWTPSFLGTSPTDGWKGQQNADRFPSQLHDQCERLGGDARSRWGRGPQHLPDATTGPVVNRHDQPTSVPSGLLTTTDA